MAFACPEGITGRSCCSAATNDPNRTSIPTLDAMLGGSSRTGLRRVWRINKCYIYGPFLGSATDMYIPTYGPYK
ncbi:hypothetical protein BR93DRAFT_931609 [Coniochaeta sp. PMI_546]|nr:hypothetical protein BR93DRAFT_931609 [Coniochaeta sp. PMI_546]